MDAEYLEASERAYNQRVMAQVSDANAVVGSWMRHLYETYKLVPGRDSIHPDGRIERVAPPPGPHGGPPGQNGDMARVHAQMHAQAREANRITGEEAT